MNIIPDKADNPNFVPMLKSTLGSFHQTFVSVSNRLNEITERLDTLSVGGGNASPGTAPSVLQTPIPTIVNNGARTVVKNRLYGRDLNSRIILAQPTIPARYVSMSAASPGQQFTYAQNGVVYIRTKDTEIDVTVNEGLAYVGEDGTVTATVPSTKIRPIGWFASGKITSNLAMVELAIIPWRMTVGIGNL